MTDDADIIIVSYGITARIAKTAIKAARDEGIKVGLLRPITLSPFPAEKLAQLAENAKAFLSVEMNMGQMVNDVKVAIDCKRPVKHFGRTGGVIPTPEEILQEIRSL